MRLPTHIKHTYFDGRVYVAVLNDGQQAVGKTEGQAHRTATRIIHGTFHPAPRGGYRQAGHNLPALLTVQNA